MGITDIANASMEELNKYESKRLVEAEKELRSEIARIRMEVLDKSQSKLIGKYKKQIARLCTLKANSSKK